MIYHTQPKKDVSSGQAKQKALGFRIHWCFLHICLSNMYYMIVLRFTYFVSGSGAHKNVKIYCII